MKKLIIGALLLAIFVSCARIVAPSGGPRDSTPPKINKSFPDNQQVDFQEKSFRLVFDEFVTLQNPNENVLISPPMNEMPEFILKNKTLTVKFLDTPAANTTYNFGFADCIKDFHEGNMLPFFQFTFSTGNFIDSCFISGKVINAETRKGEKNCYVMFYFQNIDSLPLTTRPDYLCKTDESGDFQMTNIKEGAYKIFALNDINHNLKYDLPNEAIAFQSELVIAKAMVKTDTLMKDTTAAIGTHKRGGDASIGTKIDSNFVTLRLFTVRDTVQKLDKPINNTVGIYKFPYKNELTHFEVTQLAPIDDVPYFQTINLTQDTITWYFKEPLPESVQFDLFADDHLHDTIILKPYKATRAGRGAAASAKLNIQTVNAGHFYKDLALNFSYPIRAVDSFEVVLIKKLKSANDTTFHSFSVPDTFMLNLPLSLKLEPKIPYELLIKDSVFFGYNGESHDSLKFTFTTQSEKDYGNLLINFKPERQDISYIVRLETANGSLLQKEVVKGEKELVFSHLAQGECKLIAIEDLNENGQWDTGNYGKQQQPERIILFDKPISIRGFWDLEEDFVIPIK